MPAVCFYDSCPNKLIFYIVIHLFNLLFSHSPIYSFSPSPFLPLTPHASHLTPHYSYRRASTGFLVAARQLCKLTVNRAIPKAIIPDTTNIHQLSSVSVSYTHLTL